LVVAASLERQVMQTVALRYALAPACVLLAVLVYNSPVGPTLGLDGLFVFAVLAAAWFGGAGPGLVAAVLATLALPQLIAVSYPLLGGFLDLPRFITLSIAGLAVGWGNSRRARALRDQERYVRAIDASDYGVWDWIPASDSMYTSPRLLDIYGFAPDTIFAGRHDLLARIPFHPEDRPLLLRAFTEHFAGKTARYDVDTRVIRAGETRWVHLTGMAARDPSGAVVRWTGTVQDITERKRAEEALRESEQRYARVVNVSDEAFWDWKVASDEHYTSPRFLEIFNIPPGTTFQGRAALLDSLPISAADRAALERAAADHFAGKTPRMEIEFRASVRGEDRWMQAIGRATRDSEGQVVRWNGAIQDVTARKRAEEALRESEQRYELAMAASESGYWDWHVPTDKFYASPRAFELGGYPSGTTWVDRDEYRARINMHPEDFARWEAAREELFAGTGERLAMEVRYIVRGETRWHILQAICRRDDMGKVIRWTGSTTDITDRKRAEEEVRTMERKLRQAQRLEAMGTLAGGIAHDFNNILGAILGNGEMALRDAPKGSRLARDLDTIMVAGERGRALVERILTFSRSAVGERVPVHVEGVVREVVDQVMAKLPSNVTVHPKLHAGRAAVLGDPTQVHQVVTNLASNAIQAMPAGGTLRVELAVERLEQPRAATIGGRAAGEYVVLTVADAGVGIAPEIVDRIFDPFFTTKEVGTGTGLGLSLVHGIVTDLGGAIDVASALGTGTTFTVYLPRSGDAAERSNEKDSALPRGDGQRVLIVDDEEPLVQFATRALVDLGYAPIGFTSSAAALEAFRADPERFDALITDERMPEMSGSALIREVRSTRSSLPVLLMSGYLGATAGEAPLAAGADEVLQKPLSARDLATSLARVLHL
jgi:PAS domain S-box-containing protein